MKAGLDTRAIGVRLSSDSVLSSTRTSGTKNRARYRAGSGGTAGEVLAMMMRSNGSSKINRARTRIRGYG